MNKKNELTALSKFLSLVLRHEPQAIGLVLDDAGWVSTHELLRCLAAANRPTTVELLQQVVATSDKQRFAFSDDGSLIRANQGHSIPVDLGLAAVAPPDLLYHGTANRFLDSIQQDGLTRRARHHVHLTVNPDTAGAVGQRYGQLVMLSIDAKRMQADGHLFYCTENGVWLTDTVPPAYLTVLR
jgi:putative RNA 2'-phosphotransferase